MEKLKEYLKEIDNFFLNQKVDHRILENIWQVVYKTPYVRTSDPKELREMLLILGFTIEYDIHLQELCLK